MAKRRNYKRDRRGRFARVAKRTGAVAGGAAVAAIGGLALNGAIAGRRVSNSRKAYAESARLFEMYNRRR